MTCGTRACARNRSEPGRRRTHDALLAKSTGPGLSNRPYPEPETRNSRHAWARNSAPRYGANRTRSAISPFGPWMATTGVPTAAARCIGPVGTLTKRHARWSRAPRAIRIEASGEAESALPHFPPNLPAQVDFPRGAGQRHLPTLNRKQIAKPRIMRGRPLLPSTRVPRMEHDDSVVVTSRLFSAACCRLGRAECRARQSRQSTELIPRLAECRACTPRYSPTRCDS